MSRSLIVIARSGSADEGRRHFEDALIRAAAAVPGTDVLVVPPLYHLTPDHPAVAAIQAGAGRLRVGAWLYARASQWILHGLGVSAAGRDLRCVDLRGQPDVPACVRALVADVPPEDGPGRLREIDVPVRERWYPVVDYGRCRACGQCVQFCLFGVYEQEAGAPPRVARPDNCKPGCPACARVCPEGAILFPHYTADAAISGDPDAPRPSAVTPRVVAILPLKTRPSPPAAAAPPSADRVEALIQALEEMDDG